MHLALAVVLFPTRMPIRHGTMGRKMVSYHHQMHVAAMYHPAIAFDKQIYPLKVELVLSILPRFQNYTQYKQ